MQCPYCLQDVRAVGAVAILTPDQVANTSATPPIVGSACIDCLGILAMLHDSLAHGNIRQLSERMLASGMLERR